MLVKDVKGLPLPDLQKSPPFARRASAPSHASWCGIAASPAPDHWNIPPDCSSPDKMKFFTPSFKRVVSHLTKLIKMIQDVSRISLATSKLVESGITNYQYLPVSTSHSWASSPWQVMMSDECSDGSEMGPQW